MRYNFTRQQKAEYQKRRKAFLVKNPWCVVSKTLQNKLVLATHVHHKLGRKNHYLDEETFLAVSKGGDRWIHKNKEAAQKFGWLENYES